MAVKPQDNSGFLREVDEEVRRDQAAQFWKRWGIWIAVAIFVLLAAVGGYMYWTNHQREVAAQQASDLADVLEDLDAGKLDDIEDRLDTLIASDNTGIRAAALFTRAGYALQSGNKNEAARLFGQAAGDEKLPEPYRNLALIRQTAVQYDDLQPQQVIDRLAPLTEPGSPWFGSAGEMTAIALMAQNKHDQAGQMFKRIAEDETVPESLRTRAVQMAGIMGVDAVSDEPVVEEGAPAASASAPAPPAEEVEE